MPKVIRHRDHLPGTKFSYFPHVHRYGFYGLYFAGHLFIGPNHHIQREDYDLIGFVYCKKGSYQVTIENNEVFLEEGDFVVMLLNSKSVQKAHKSEESELYVGYFEGFDLVRRFEFYMDDKIKKLSKTWAPSFIELIEKGLTNKKGNVYDETIETYTILTRVLQELEHKTSKEQKPIIFINNFYYDNSLNLKKIAKSCGYSPFHFLRIFKERFGVTPIEYLKNIRLTKATDLLYDKNLSITTISDLVGFNDQRSFVKLFKERYHTTPKKYRMALEKEPSIKDN